MVIIFFMIKRPLLFEYASYISSAWGHARLCERRLKHVSDINDDTYVRFKSNAIDLETRVNGSFLSHRGDIVMTNLSSNRHLYKHTGTSRRTFDVLAIHRISIFFFLI